MCYPVLLQVFLSDLHNSSSHQVTVTAVSVSTVSRHVLYESKFSRVRLVYVSPGCDINSQFISLPHSLEYNAGIIAGIISVTLSLVILFLVTFLCRLGLWPFAVGALFLWPFGFSPF